MIKETASAEIALSGTTLSVFIQGEIDHHTAKPLREKIDRAIFMYHPKSIRFDLSSVSFMDSSGLGLILGRVSVAEDVGASIRLANAGPRILKILSLAGIKRIKNLTVESEVKQ